LLIAVAVFLVLLPLSVWASIANVIVACGYERRP
jgi:hypothetical protein